MNKRITSPLVLGLGKVGHLVALLLKKSGFNVTGGDLRPEGSFEFPVISLDINDQPLLAKILKNHDAIISCLPYYCNHTIATAAAHHGIHYFDLTEDVKTTKKIIALSHTSPGVMIPQCGLAPGFIGIVGASLASRFRKIRSLKLRVGALPKHPTGLLGYAFNWSPEGVVNEYLNDCEVIEDGVRKWISPLEWLETLVINGVQLEAFTTSGGLGTMCETFEGKVANLDYKSIRYPGHALQMNFFLHELLMRENRKQAGTILVNAKPPTSEDVVYIHASVEGWKDEEIIREEFVRSYDPKIIDDTQKSTISWTTAASICSVVELVNDRILPPRGFVKQEDISLDHFLSTHNGRLYSDFPDDAMSL